jgi:hypothetical protein
LMYCLAQVRVERAACSARVSDGFRCDALHEQRDAPETKVQSLGFTH